MLRPRRQRWPVTLVEGDVGLRPIAYRDRDAWYELRRVNAAWLGPWESTSPDPDAPAVTFRQMVRRLHGQARAGEAFPWVLTVGGVLAGQVNVTGVARSSAQMGHVGYWIGEAYAGRGAMPTAVALAVDHCLLRAGLHRLEINIRPENRASLRVVEKLGLRCEGLRERYLHIDGAWRDHLSYAITTEELDEDGLLGRWRRSQR
jgi:ribosomal-protein-alanine N-acetyltransferase